MAGMAKTAFLHGKISLFLRPHLQPYLAEIARIGRYGQTGRFLSRRHAGPTYGRRAKMLAIPMAGMPCRPYLAPAWPAGYNGGMWRTFDEYRLRSERAWLIGIALSSRAHPLAGGNAMRLLDSLEAEMRRRRQNDAIAVSK